MKHSSYSSSVSSENMRKEEVIHTNCSSVSGEIIPAAMSEEMTLRQVR